MLEPCAVKVASTVLRRGLHREMGFLSVSKSLEQRAIISVFASRNNYSTFSGVNTWNMEPKDPLEFMSRNNYSTFSGVNKSTTNLII